MGMRTYPPVLATLAAILLGLAFSLASSGAEGEASSSSATLTASAPGGISLQVDGRDLPRGLLHAQEELSVVPGDVALVFPKWLPGAHAPAGRVDNLIGLRFTSAAQVLRWDRDEVDPYRITVHVPAGATTLDIELSYIANQADSNSIGVDVTGDASIALICWNCCVLYPEGRPVATIPVDVQLTTPANWQVASQLTQAEHHKDTFRFARTSLRDLVDQPLVAGLRVVDIPLAGIEPAALVSVASANEMLQLDPRWIDKLGKTSSQARLLFGRAHYRSYRWLFVSGEGLDGIGLEHANCSLCGLGDDVMAAYDKAGYDDRNLPVHEYVHSWCGKHVRPAAMATPDFQAAQRLGLLWVYEGLTQYLGEVLGVRATFATAQEFREQLAFNIHDLAHQSGRSWRSVEDTARASFLLRDPSRHYHELRRDQDYYIEGMLFWLEADLIIRTESHGKSSLDDFARSFLGQPVEPGAVKTYAREDVIAALEAVQHHDWKSLIDARISAIRPDMGTTCLEGSGWKLTYGPTVASGSGDDDESFLDARASFGCQFHEGRVMGLVPGSPAALAGLSDGTQVHKINGLEFTGANLEAALRKAHDDGTGALTVTTVNGKVETEVAAKCLVGPLHPHLEHAGGADLLDEILRPRSSAP
jgi:predicted metalloprotease with PDZ domain